MPPYTLGALAAAITAILFELAVCKSGIFLKRYFWITLLIVFAFQVPVDGWLTKLSSPIVAYNHLDFLGIRFPFSIPIEDFIYGFALVTPTISIWERLGTNNKRR